MLAVVFTQESKIENLFCGAPYGSESSLFFNNISLFSMGFKPIQDSFQHDFAWMNNGTDSSIVLAEL